MLREILSGVIFMAVMVTVIAAMILLGHLLNSLFY